MPETPESKVDALLASSSPVRPSSIDLLPDLKAAILHFFKRKRAGEIHHPFGWFYREKIQPAFGGPSERAARDYVRDRLRLNVATGEHLDD